MTGRQLIEKSLSEHFGRPMRLVLEDAPDLAARAGLSLAEQEQQSRDAYERSTEAKVRAHAAVRSVLRVLGGEIEHVQVLDKERPPAEPDTNDEGA